MIGKKIKNLIDSSPKTQIEISEMLGISRPTLQRLFERENVDTKILFSLCEKFDVDMSYFFDDIEISKKNESNTQNSVLEKKYEAVLQENFSLRQELSDLKDKFIAFQMEVFQMRKEMSLGKDRALLENGFVTAKVVRMPTYESGYESGNVKFGF